MVAVWLQYGRSSLMVQAELLHFVDVGRSTDCFFLLRTTDSPFCSTTATESLIEGQTQNTENDAASPPRYISICPQRVRVGKRFETQALVAHIQRHSYTTVKIRTTSRLNITRATFPYCGTYSSFIAISIAHVSYVYYEVGVIDFTNKVFGSVESRLLQLQYLATIIILPMAHIWGGGGGGGGVKEIHKTSSRELLENCVNRGNKTRRKSVLVV